jgi:hypothetical protein
MQVRELGEDRQQSGCLISQENHLSSPTGHQLGALSVFAITHGGLLFAQEWSIRVDLFWRDCVLLRQAIGMDARGSV